MDLQDLEQLAIALTQAELDGDPEEFSKLLADDFRGVGPAGFVLNKEQWAQRFNRGLVNEEFEFLELAWRIREHLALGIGIQRQKTNYQGQRTDGNYRITLIAVPTIGGAQLAGVQLSPIKA